MPGIARVETYRVLQGQEFRDARIAVVALSPGFSDTEQFRRQVIAGGEAAMRELHEGRGVIISDNLADRLGLEVGEVLDLPTPHGTGAPSHRRRHSGRLQRRPRIGAHGSRSLRFARGAIRR